MSKDLFNKKKSRFSIRKLNVGVCSVLLGTLVMVGTASSVAADENAENQVGGCNERRSRPTCDYNGSTRFNNSEVSTSATTYQAEAPVTAPETAPTTTAPVEEKAPVATPAVAEGSTNPSNKGTEGTATDNKETVSRSCSSTCARNTSCSSSNLGCSPS